MKRVIDTSEVLGTVELPEGVCEVCASADANYDESAGKLVIGLDSFIRTTNLGTMQRWFASDWLPKPEKVRESVGPDEAPDLARDIFNPWAREVRAAAPLLHDG
jgi:hypothetical protein